MSTESAQNESGASGSVATSPITDPRDHANPALELERLRDDVKILQQDSAIRNRQINTLMDQVRELTARTFCEQAPPPSSPVESPSWLVESPRWPEGERALCAISAAEDPRASDRVALIVDAIVAVTGLRPNRHEMRRSRDIGAHLQRRLFQRFPIDSATAVRRVHEAAASAHSVTAVQD